MRTGAGALPEKRMVPATLPVGPAGASAAGRESDGGGVVAGMGPLPKFSDFLSAASGLQAVRERQRAAVKRMRVLVMGGLL